MKSPKSTSHRVSIVINNFNYADFLEDCINSALAQSVPAYEVIVIDDGSTDGSRRILKQFTERVLVVLKENGGQASALNRGFEVSNGDLVLFLDSDDCLLPHAVSTISRVWESDFCKLQFPLNVIDSAGRIRRRLPKSGEILPSGDLLADLLDSNSYWWMPTSGNVFCRRVLERIMPIPEEQFRISADLYLSIRSVRYGLVGAESKPLGLYREHDRNAYSSGRLLARDNISLKSRAASHVARIELLAQEAKLSNWTLPKAPHIHYSTLYSWLDLSLALRFVDGDLPSWVNPAEVIAGLEYRMAQGSHASPQRLAAGTIRLLFQLLLTAPRPIVYILWRCGLWLDFRVLNRFKPLLVSDRQGAKV